MTKPLAGDFVGCASNFVLVVGALPYPDALLWSYERGGSEVGSGDQLFVLLVSVVCQPQRKFLVLQQRQLYFCACAATKRMVP